MKTLFAVIVAISAAAYVVSGTDQQATAQQATAPHHLTIEQLLEIRHPSSPIWSPDGRHIAFLWDRAGISTWYVVDVDGRGGQPRPLTSNSAGPGSPAASGTGMLWQLPIEGGEARPLWTAALHASNLAMSPDGTRLALVRESGASSIGRHRGGGSGGSGADLVLRPLDSGPETRIAHDDVSIGSVSWAPDGRHLAYTAGARAIRHEQTPSYSGAKIIYTVTERTPGQTYVVSASGGRPVAVGAQRGFGGARWLDRMHLVFDRQSSDYKRRTTYVADIATGLSRVIHEDVDEKFWSIPGDAGAAAQPSPDGKWVAFLSDRDGWDHLYVVAAAPAARASRESSSSEPIQITKGRFEVWRPSWSPDSTRIAFDANDADHPGDRHLGIATIDGDPGRATVTMITTGRGADIGPSWSPDGKRLVYQHTDPRNSADLYLIDAAPAARASGREPVRLTNSMPDGMDRSAFIQPELVHYPGPDGQPVPGWLFVPNNLDRSKKHPAIVWIHGDGVNQNYDGWHVQRNYAVYYSFHQYLLQKGYVVFAPDYRGSIGYGKAWRQGVYMDVGGNDAKDAWMAATYLKTLAYVDADCIGVWGLSYGGFFTLIAVTDQPKLFRAAVDVAGVVDYAMYYDDPYHGGWTASRIGTPERNPKIYAQASPISHIDRLERPLLVLHGTADVNVPYLHSVRLMDELLQRGKSDLASFMTYPGEFHYFTRAHVLRDAWHRVEAFFDANLRPEGKAAH